MSCSDDRLNSQIVITYYWDFSIQFGHAMIGSDTNTMASTV